MVTSGLYILPRWLNRFTTICLSHILTDWISLAPVLIRSTSCFAQSPKQDKQKEQKYANRYRSISKIKDSKVIPNLRNTKENEVDNIPTPHGPVNQIPHCPSNYETKNELKCQWACVEHTRIEVDDETDRNPNEDCENSVVRQ